MPEKKPLTKENIRFLQELQEQMLTQDDCGQAAPRYWGIVELTREYGIEDGYEDDCELYRISTNHYIVSMKEAAEEIRCRKEDILAYSDFDEYDQMGVTLRTRRLSDGRIYGHRIHVRFSNKAGDVDEYDLYDFKDVEDFLNETVGLGDDYRRANYRIHEKVVPGPIFLTQKAAQDYCDRYGYNHQNPRPYALTAFRSSEIERLWKIIEQTDWKPQTNRQEEENVKA